MKRPNIKGETVKRYLMEYPNTYTKTLAKLIFKENPGLFDSVESTRSSVRWYRGAKKDGRGKRCSDPKLFRDPELARQAMVNPFRLPKSDESEYLPFTLPGEANNILALYDVHVPYHNIEACNAAMEYGKENNINAIVIGGDMMDFHKISRYESDPKARNMKGELKKGRKFLSALRRTFPDAKIYYIEGNHEVRLKSYLRVHAPALLGMEEFELPSLLKFDKYGVEFIQDKRMTKAGELTILHGHELQGGASSPINVARGLYQKTKVTSMCGHHHQVSEHSEKDLDGKRVTCWSVGTLGELRPQYMPINKWEQGFAHILVNEDNTVKVFNKRIEDGKII